MEFNADYNYVKHLRLMLVFLLIGIVAGIALSFTIPSAEALEQALLAENVKFTSEEVAKFLNTYRLIYLFLVPVSFAGTVNGVYYYWSYIRNKRAWLIGSIVLWPVVLVFCWLGGTLFILPAGAYCVLAILQTRKEE